MRCVRTRRNCVYLVHEPLRRPMGGDQHWGRGPSGHPCDVGEGRGGEGRVMSRDAYEYGIWSHAASGRRAWALAGSAGVAVAVAEAHGASPPMQATRLAKGPPLHSAARRTHQWRGRGGGGPA